MTIKPNDAGSWQTSILQFFHLDGLGLYSDNTEYTFGFLTCGGGELVTVQNMQSGTGLVWEGVNHLVFRLAEDAQQIEYIDLDAAIFYENATTAWAADHQITVGAFCEEPFFYLV